MNIDTLITDIYGLLDKPNVDMEFNVEQQAALGARMVRHIEQEIKDPDRSHKPETEVYVTQFTSNCDRKIFYNIVGGPHLRKERVPGHNRFKFLYGDLIEESVLYLAELAGHEVSHQQHRLEVDLYPYRLCGRIDALIDGYIVDVKSMDYWSFERMVKGEYEDKWGYYLQLQIYRDMWNHLGLGWPKGLKILAVNKMNGKLHLQDVPAFKDPDNVLMIKTLLDDLGALYSRPTRDTEVKAGNMILKPGCSYCPYKFDCYEEPGYGGLEVYAYSNGPTFVVKDSIKKEPKVPKITEAYQKETGIWKEK